MIGQEDFVLSRDSQADLEGRLLVGDPRQLESLQLHAVYVFPSKGGHFQQNAKIGRPHGRFSIEGTLLNGLSLELRESNTQERLALWKNPPSDTKDADGVVILPDWDLRNKVFRHHLKITDSHGEAITGARISFQSEGYDLNFLYPGGEGFLSSQSQIELKVSAPGYLRTTVLSQESTEVTLRRGIAVDIEIPDEISVVDADNPLNGFWTVGFARKQDGVMKRSKVIPEQPLVAGRTMTFMLDEPGEWAVFCVLRTVEQLGAERTTRVAGHVNFPSGERWHSIEVEDTSELQHFLLPLE